MSANFLLLAAFACVLLLLLAAAPAYAVARPSRAARIRNASTAHVALWWAAAVAPWAAAWLTAITPSTIGLNITTTREIAVLATVGLAAYLLLVALPVAVITATAIWMTERRRRVADAAGPRP